ncbi:hypothetical protein CDV36_012897 [Fusarium kuroshium]|uniref:DUF6546 domain-containing protein n=1 Tax=Fusarium kuroshium TaxID=2010991 RepID=A0A3M2RQM0_9HYPO|nr:hypothetical protein CDV36_012897 [Fusarium kuroshium]
MASCTAAAKSVFPPEIELCILEWLIPPPHNTSKDRFARPSNFACVCKAWQRIIEQSTFRHISLRPEHIPIFSRLTSPASGRRGYVKHVLLEILALEDDDEASHNYSATVFTRAVSTLWKVLSDWQHSHGLTVELGVFSSFETRMHRLHSFLYTPVPEGDIGSIRTNPYTDYSSRFENPPTNQIFLSTWEWRKQCYLGSRSLEFRFGEHESLYSARVITRLLIRRRYFRNIGPKALCYIFRASPCLEAIHLERWCYGRARSDEEWDKDSSLIGLNLTSSLKQFSFYDEFNTMYHQQGRMRIPRSNKRLLKSLAENTGGNQLEHLSISFVFDAQDFFSPRYSHNWASLTTLALTSNLVLTCSSEVVNELLVKVAEVAKHMPRLEMLEIWNCKVREKVAGIFRYEKSDRTGNIVWQGTWELYMSRQVQRAWQEVFIGSDGGYYELGVEVMSLEPEGLVNLGSIYPYLKLRKHVLDGISWTQV